MTRALDGLNWLPTTINDSQKFFLFDIGEDQTQLFPEAAADMNLPVNPTRYSIVDIYGYSSTKVASYKDYSMGGLRVKNSSFYLSPQGNPSYAANKLQAGKLGLSHLKLAYDIDMDFGSNVLGLFDFDHCDGQVVYWKSDAVVVVPIAYNSLNQIVVPVTVDGVALSGILSPGIAKTTLNLNTAEDKLKFNTDEPGVEKQAAGDTVIYHKRFKSLELGGIGIGNPLLEIIPDRMHRALNVDTAPQLLQAGVATYEISRKTPADRKLADVVIGADFLNKLHVYFATKEQKLYISPASAPVAAAAGQ